MQLTTGQASIRMLEAYGVDTVFGIPGVHTLEFYRGLHGSSIRHITPRHEQGAAYMADAYGRVTGTPGVCLVITGAGLTNAATPIGCAYHDSKPLLVLSSATDTADARRGVGALHDLPDQRELMRQLIEVSVELSHPDELEEAFAIAWEVFESRRPRPVHIGIPTDVLAAVRPWTDPETTTPPRPMPHADSVRIAADALAGAERPMILAGGGALEAGTQLSLLAARIGAPIASTINAKGIVPDDHPLSVGAKLPLPRLVDELEAADVVLAVGTEFSEVDYYDRARIPQPRGKLVRIDIDPAQLANGTEATLALHGDASHALAALLSAVDVDDRRQRAGVERASELRALLARDEEDTPFRSVLDTLARSLPRDTIYALDSTQIAYVANHYLAAWRPRSWLSTGGFGPLGSAVPMAVGAWLAEPTRPVVALVGDGGLLFTVQELGTAVALGAPVIVVVWNNDGYEEIRDAMDAAGFPHIGTDVTTPDIPRVAEGFGCRAERPDSLAELHDVLCDALETPRGPLLVDVPADIAS